MVKVLHHDQNKDLESVQNKIEHEGWGGAPTWRPGPRSSPAPLRPHPHQSTLCSKHTLESVLTVAVHIPIPIFLVAFIFGLVDRALGPPVI